MANQNKKSHNPYGYFYKEKDGKDIKNVKDFFEKTDFKKYGKFSLKGFKWSLYLFLIITTLWGCVQGFIIKQSNLLGHGLEIYKEADEVNANMYLGAQTTHAEIRQEAKLAELSLSTPGGQWEVEHTPEVPGTPVTPAKVELKAATEFGYNPNITITQKQLDDWNDDTKEKKLKDLNWAELESSELWSKPTPGNDINNIKPVNEMFSPVTLFNTISFGKYNFVDASDKKDYVLKGIEKVNTLEYLNTILLAFKWNESKQNTYINKWNTINEYGKEDSDYKEPIPANEIKSNMLKAYYSGEIYMGDKDGLLYGNTYNADGSIMNNAQDNAKKGIRSIKWNNTNKEEDVKNENGNFDNSKIFVDGKNDSGIKYIEVPKVYYNVMPQQSGIHLKPNDNYTSTTDLDFIKQERTNWDKISTSGNNQEMVNNAGWTMLDFVDNYSLSKNQMKEQYIPSFYDKNNNIEVDKNGVIKDNGSTTKGTNEKLYATNIEEWKKLNTNNPTYINNPNKLLPYIDWNAINMSKDLSEDDKKAGIAFEYGHNLQYGGLSPMGTKGVIPDTGFEQGINSRKDFLTTNLNFNLPDKPKEGGIIEIKGEISKDLTLEYTSGGQDDYKSIVEATTKFDANQDTRIIITNWKDAWKQGPFYGMFVYPLSIFATTLEEVVPVDVIGGWAVFIGIMIIVFLLRGLSTLATFKNYIQQQKMQDLQLKVAKINSKYEKYKDNPQMKQRKQMETMKLYKKEGVNPLGSLSSVFLTMPMFLAMWRIISSLPIYKGASIGPVDFTITPISGVFGGVAGAAVFIYLLLLIATIMMQFISFKLPTWLSYKRKGVSHIDEKTKKSMKKQQKVGNWMIVFFLIMSITIPTLLALYWMLSGLFTLSTTWLQHLYLSKKASAAKEGIEWLGPIDKTKQISKKIWNNMINKKVED